MKLFLCVPDIFLQWIQICDLWIYGALPIANFLKKNYDKKKQ